MIEYEQITERATEKELTSYWNAAVGLQEVDGLKPSEYLKELAQKNVEGSLDNRQIEELLYAEYENETPEQKLYRTKECDIVSNRIVELLQMDGLQLNMGTLQSIHRYLFKGIYENAGEFRKYNISKKEPILGGRTVKYANYQMIEETLRYDFGQEMEQSYSEMTPEQMTKRIAKFSSSIWQVHPFSEGNTRTTAVFMERYLNQVGFHVNNDLFKEYSQYFRNALVRSNYADYPAGIVNTYQHLEKFYENLLFEGTNKLRSRDLVIEKLVIER